MLYDQTHAIKQRQGAEQKKYGCQGAVSLHATIMGRALVDDQQGKQMRGNRRQGCVPAPSLLCQ